MDDFAKCVGKEEGGAGEIENVFAFAAESAEAFNCRSGIAALRTERRLDGNERGPAVGAGRAPFAFEYRRAAYNACYGKEKIED